MQSMKPRWSRGKAFAILIALLVAVGGIVWLVISLFSGGESTGVSAHLLPCAYNETLKPFGRYVLYYDGRSIHCMSERGGVRWSFQIGADAGFDCDENVVVAWAGHTVYILDSNGNSTYNDDLGAVIQFARAGKQYVAAIVGDTASPRLIVKDHSGAQMDEEADAYANLIMLDVGFYGKNGEYMWTLALDVFGTAANTLLNTYEVGTMNTGEVSLGDSITYGVLYENSILRVIGTRKILAFNYRGTEDVTQSVLVYGWRMIGNEIPDRGDALMLFAPTSQTENIFDIRELRVISASADKRLSLPDTCVGASIWNKTVYAMSERYLYSAGMNDSKFTKYELPLETAVTRFIGTLSNGYALVACNENVYTVSLPKKSGS